LSFAKQGSFDLGQGLLLERLHGPLDLIEGLTPSFETVGLPGSGDGVSFVVFKDDANAGHEVLLLPVRTEANLPSRAITGKWTGRNFF
jgi:hypothetical protein